jgi:hypothetical protein
MTEQTTKLPSFNTHGNLRVQSTLLPTRLLIPILLSCALAIDGCSGDVEVPREEAPPTVETTELDMEWPTLEKVDPSPAIIGQEVKIVGRGGYQEIETEAGTGYDESYRTFQLYLDDEAIGEIGCYVNRCEAELILPIDLEPGQHEFSVEGGSSITISVDAQ